MMRPQGLTVRLLFQAAVLILSVLGGGGYAEDVIDIGSRRELFVDRFLIDRMSGVALSLERPRDEGIAVKFDRPWEGAFCGYATVLRYDGRFRAYYRGLPGAG